MRPRTRALRHLCNWLLVFSFLANFILPYSGYEIAHAAVELPYTDIEWTALDNSDETVIEEPSVINGQQAPVVLNATIHLDQRPWLVAPGESFAVELVVEWWMAEPVDAVELVLSLPPEISTQAGATGEMRQPLPTLGYGESYATTFELVSLPSVDASTRVVILRGGLACPGCQEIWTERILGIRENPVARGEDLPGIDEAGRAAVTVDPQGGVMESPDGAVVLLVPPGVVSVDADFRYEAIYHWNQAVHPVSAEPDQVISATMTATQQIWLPLVVSAGAADIGAHPDTPVGTIRSAEDDEPAADSALDLALEDNGVWLFNLWQFEAQVGEDPLQVFTTPVELLVDLSGWEEAGVVPDSLSLWTRETPEDAWTMVPSRLDEDVLSAELTHFSQFGLGAALSTSGDRPPSMQMFTVDQLTGAANVAYAIDAPAGLGGLRPNLAFAYSSASQDDLIQEAGDWQIVTQASSVGAGWRLDGISYIARIGRENKFALVLNGQSATILKQDGVWRTSPSIFAQISWAGDGSSTGYGQWIVTATDGVRYEFGNAGSMPDSFVATSATALMLEQTPVERNTYRQAKRWYLQRVIDPSGNAMEYRYRGEQGWESGCMNSDWVVKNRHWFTRALDPTEILWSRNDAGGVGEYKMRVQFVYDQVNIRQDLRIKGKAAGDCIQAMFGEFNQLKDVRVDVLVSGAWRTLRSYQLTQLYKRFTKAGAEDMIRPYLTSIVQRGARNSPLLTHSFAYDWPNPNRMMLRTANNGQGGAITYSYGAQSASCSSGVCPYGSARMPVTRSDLADGLGGSIRTDNLYGPGVVANDGGFRGFRDVAITHYDVDRTGAGNNTVLRWEKIETFGGEGATDRDNPDPRRGRIRRRTVKSDPWTSTVMAIDEYDWQVYWGKNGGWQWSPGQTWERGAQINGVYQRLYHPLWVRNEAKTQTVGTAVNVSRFAFQPERQNNSQYGNVTEVKEFADGVLLRTAVTEYYPNGTNNVVSLPARMTVFDAQGNCVAETRNIYGAYYANGAYVTQVEGSYNQAPLNAKLVKSERRLRGGCTTAAPVAMYDLNWAITRYAYDAVGNQTTLNRLGEVSSGAQDLVIQTGYDSVYRLFPVEQSYSKLPAHKETATYYGVNGLAVDDAKAYWGAIQEHCGVNELCTRQAYDEYGRPFERWELVSKGAVWGGSTSADVRWIYLAWGQSGLLRNVAVEWRAPRCYGNFVRRIYNGLGQLVQEQRPNDGWQYAIDGCVPGGNSVPEIDVDYRYDGLGRQVQASIPHATGQQWVNRAADWNQGYASTVYDALDRPLRTVAANGSQTEMQYTGRKTVVVGRGRGGDADKVLSWTETDGAGNLLRVQTWTKPIEQGGGLEGEVVLTHDALGNLTRVALPSGGVATMSYDMAGRKVAMSDPDLGAWTYAYDRQGNLARQTDARQQTTCLYYDVIGRLAGKDLNQGNASGCAAAPAQELTYSYDSWHSTSNRSRGQVTQVRYADGSYTRNLSYNSKGLLAAESVSIGGAPQSYTTGYSYDAYNRLATTTYPGGETVTVSGFTARRLPTGLTNQPGSITLVDNVAYDVAGRQTRQRYPAGGSVQRLWNYAPFNQQDSNGGMLAGIRVEQTGVRLLALDYAYDSFGNMKGQNDNSGGWTWFSYDAQNRLTNAYARDYAYDAAGRMPHYEGSNRNYSGAGPVHAVRGSGYIYDANGNLTQRPGLTLAWNAENRLASATPSGMATESYIYDDAGIRVKKASYGVTTYYPFPHYEVQVSSSGVATTQYYFFGGQRIAMKRSGQPLTFLYGDSLNSTVMATQGGVATSHERYYAYGRDRFANTVPTDNRFTGQKEDATGLVYMNARYYDPVLGQFVSPDTLVPDATNLFDYNRYMYVRGNPLKYTDPSGHYSVDELMQHFGVDSFDALMGLFSEGGKYAGNSGWYDILRAAQDGDNITATFADQSTTMQGSFKRNKDGRIVVNINGQEIDDYGFARFGGYVLGGKDSGLPSDYGMYHLNGKSGEMWATAISGRLALNDLPCNTWDCTDIALNSAIIGGDLLRSSSPFCGPAAGTCYLAGNAVVRTASLSSYAYATSSYMSGQSSEFDVAFALAGDLASLNNEIPVATSVTAGIQLLWNLADPFIADDPQSVAR